MSFDSLNRFQKPHPREGLISTTEEAEKVRADEVEPSKYCYVAENGERINILRKVRMNDEVMLILSRGGPIRVPIDDKVSVVKRTYRVVE